MAETQPGRSEIYVQINYEDPYVQPLILSALKTCLPKDSYRDIESISELPSPNAPCLQILQYEAIAFEHLMEHPTTSLANAYVIRKALIRKHYLSTTVANWITKHPNSVLKSHVKPSVAFEVDYAEFLDDALIEAYELKESWGRNGGNHGANKEYWILKPGMSERGQGIRIFSSEEELTEIFEEWDPETDDDDDDKKEEENHVATSDDEATPAHVAKEAGSGIVTSQLRHFIAQPYIHPPLLLNLDNLPPRKFHIRTYVLAIGALKVFVYKPMLALSAARPYVPPWESNNDEEALRVHLTNTCLQDSGEREGSVSSFWSLPNSLKGSNASSKNREENWKEQVFEQICDVTGEVFEAAARGMSIHFQPLPNAFELFGLDFLVGVDEDKSLTTYLLEINAFPDFRQTGEELKGLVEDLFEGVVEAAIKPFLGFSGDRGEKNLVRVLDIDLGRR